MPSDRNDRSERILRAAMHLFHERGFGSVGVDLIGERAGMSGPAIYRYFAGKDEILVTLIDEAIDRVLLSAGTESEDPWAELDHLVSALVQRMLQERELMSVWTKERNSLPAQHRSRIRTRINRYIARWVDCVDRCYPGHPREVLVSAVHATHGLIDSTAFWPAPALKAPGLDRLLSGMALSSLRWLDGEATTGQQMAAAARR